MVLSLSLIQLAMIIFCLDRTGLVAQAICPVATFVPNKHIDCHCTCHQSLLRMYATSASSEGFLPQVSAAALKRSVQLVSENTQSLKAKYLVGCVLIWHCLTGMIHRQCTFPHPHVLLLAILHMFDASIEFVVRGGTRISQCHEGSTRFGNY